jgi:hypothetical protein
MAPDRRFASDGQLFVTRLLLPILLLPFGAGVGRIGADIVWGAIYGIGGRVVSDEQYEELYDDVGDWGAIAGACSGLAVNVLPRLWPVGAFALLQLLSVLAGMMAGSFGWKPGLIGFFGVHALAIVGCILFMVAVLAKHFMCRNDSV